MNRTLSLAFVLAAAGCVPLRSSHTSPPAVPLTVPGRKVTAADVVAELERSGFSIGKIDHKSGECGGPDPCTTKASVERFARSGPPCSALIVTYPELGPLQRKKKGWAGARSATAGNVLILWGDEPSEDDVAEARRAVGRAVGLTLD